MQRLFSSFPAGGPGFALVLLRACVAGLFAFDASGHLALAATLACVAAGALVMLLLLGLAMPLACVLCVACELAFALRGAAPPAPLTLLVLVEGLALALLGPGAYSVDGVMFGRRRVVWPLPRG